MKIIANSIRAGHILEYKDKLYVVSKTPDHIKPGKGGAYVQVEMKDLKTGTKINDRLHSDDTVEKVSLDQQVFQYLYADDDSLHLMNMEDFDQIQIPKTLVGEKIIYLQNDMKLTVESYNGTPIRITLPDTMVLEITETEPVVKGQTAASSYKPAILENGVRVMVPPFIEVGTKVIVRIEDNEYMERYKS